MSLKFKNVYAINLLAQGKSTTIMPLQKHKYSKNEGKIIKQQAFNAKIWGRSPDLCLDFGTVKKILAT